MGVDAAAQVAQWLHVLPRLPVSDMDRSLAYYQDALGLRLAWRTVDGGLAALSSGGVEILLLVPWTHEGPVPAQSAYIYVADPDAMCAACREAGGDVVEPVASRAHGMRDFVVRDPDGHRFTLGRGEERLREVADHYGLTPEQISVDPDWLARRQSR